MKQYNDFLSRVGVEAVMALEANHTLARTMTRKLEDYTGMPEENIGEIFSKYYSYVEFKIPDSDIDGLLTTEEFVAKHIKPSVSKLVAQSQKTIYSHLITLLSDESSCVPSILLDSKQCIDWVERKFRYNRTRSNDRILLLTYNGHKQVVSNTHNSNDWQFWIDPIIKEYSIAFQRDALTLTTFQLPVDRNRRCCRNIHHNGVGCRIYMAYNAVNKCTEVKLDTVMQLTKVNLLHCCLIPDNIFCA